MDKIPYASAVGSLMYAMVGSRPDLAFAVGLVSRFMSKTSREHWETVKWMMRYLQGAKDVCLIFTKAWHFDIEGFSDSDKRRSVTGYVFKVVGNTISWRSCLQHVVALSTTEAEYMALSEATKEGLWLREFCGELSFNSEFFKLHCDAQSAIFLAKNSVHHDRTKHVASKIHFIRDIIDFGMVKVLKIHATLNPADILTKSLPGNAFEKHLVTLEVVA
ncbi:secreted RxLR effector protein 161-like [Brassica napus]|uniref:secreted RxLR effector protein 161-like n=1 Tax=Brassica napus TaxID=3708 RepID=UPI002079F8D2|nr:secreted RxLR effector protein 161-like [Brassica napus]